MKLRLLRDDEFEIVHATFLAAFADYAIDASFDAETLRRLMVRRGADLKMSVGAFDGEELVAVMAVAIDDFEGIRSAYDVFTGVVPSHRGRSLATRMFEVAREELLAREVQRFVLEVICDNEPALRAYRRAGFSVRRRLTCHVIPVDAFLEAHPFEPSIQIEVHEDRRCVPRSFRDWAPSWQNCDASVRRAAERVVTLIARVEGRSAGVAVVAPQSRDLPQWGVSPSERRRGVGTALLCEAARRVGAGKVMRVINVPEDAIADQGLFTRPPIGLLTPQFEMELPLGGTPS